eukprot:6209049-Pleurochrysis_carterae.AAC.1
MLAWHGAKRRVMSLLHSGRFLVVSSSQVGSHETTVENAADVEHSFLRKPECLPHLNVVILLHLLESCAGRSKPLVESMAPKAKKAEGGGKGEAKAKKPDGPTEVEMEELRVKIAALEE